VLHGRPRICGAFGCAEAEAAGWSLPGIANDWPGISDSVLSKFQHVGFKELFEQSAKGDPVAMAIRERCMDIWAALSVGLVHAYDPKLILIGGGVMKCADEIQSHIESYVQDHSWTPWGKVQVRAAELGNNAALLGAIPLLGERESR
jgi:glucokinase